MTMIVIAVHADRAQILTDSIAYTTNGQHVRTDPGKRVTHLPGIAAAVLTQGSIKFRDVWQPTTQAAASEASDFDTFTAVIEAVLPTARDQTRRNATAAGLDITHDGGIEVQFAAFHVGWSPSAGRFVAYVYFDSPSGLLRHPLDGLYVMPAPLGQQLGIVEATRIAGWLIDDGQPADPAAAWMTCPPPPTPPLCDDDWVALAKACHRSRALDCSVDSGLKVYVGGDVQLTTVTRDTISVRTIHAFTDPDEFRAMVAGTLHPLSQTRPCPCGNGKSWLDCELLPQIGHLPCECGSGRTFAECCSVYAAGELTPTREEALA